MAANHDMPFFLVKKDAILVKPSSATPSDVLSLSTIDNDYVFEQISQTIYVYQANTNHPNGADSDPAHLIREALSRVLFYYYPLAGKLKRQSDGTLRIKCNADGVPFLEATANCQLSSLGYFDGIDTKTAKQFLFYPETDSDDGYHPLALQVTKFSCGGFTIGMGLSHSVCDGTGAAQFFRAMAELASGKTEPSVKPVWERERLAGKPSGDPITLLADAASMAASPYWPTTDLVHGLFNITSDGLSKLKNSLTKEIENETLDESFSFTTIEALGAYVWRSRIRAFELNPDGKSIFHLAVGIRNITNPPLPPGYYGNAFLSSPSVFPVKDLHEGPLSNVAKMIKESKKRASNNDYVGNTLSFLETVRQQRMKIEGGAASTILTDWRRLGLLEEVDFGWKGAVNIVPVLLNIVAFVEVCILLPPCSLDPAAKGGLRLLVSLPRAAMAKFEEEMNAL